MLKQENLAANLYGLLCQKQRVRAIEWRILGQEHDGSILASWITSDDPSAQFSNIGLYNVKEKTFDILYSFNKRENIVQATVNQSKTLLVYVIKDQCGSENSFIYKAILTEINNAEPKPPLILQEKSHKQIMTQFIWGKLSTFEKKNQDRFLVMVHEENVLLFTAMFKKSSKVLEEQLKNDLLRTDRIDYTRPDGWYMDQDLLRKETIVRNFTWAQFDSQIQALYYIHVKTPAKSILFDNGDGGNSTPNVTPTLSALQFHDDLPTETVLNIPLNLPKIPTSNSASNCYEDDTIPLRVHDSSLNLNIVSDESGMIFVCHYYLYQPIKQPDEDCSSKGDSTDDVHFAYSVTTLHHGVVIHCVIPGIPWEKAKCMKPTFTLHGDHHMLVFQSDLFLHLLDIGLSHEPCCHLVCPPLRHSVAHLVPVFKTNNIAFDSATLDLISIKIPKAHLIEAFRNDTSLDNRLSIVHYFLAHSNDIDIFSELLNIIMERPLSLDTVPLLKEALISGAYASSQKGLPSDALTLLTLLPLTTSNISKPLHAKVLDLSVGLSHENLHNTTMMLLSPQQRLSPYRTDIWTKCYEKLNENKDWKRFVPDQVKEKLMYSLVAYQPEALSRCTTPMSPSTQFVGASFSDLATISAASGSSSSNLTRRQTPYDALPFHEIENCTASKQEHVISVNLRELSMHLVKYSVKQITGFRWLKDSYFDRNPAPTHVHAVATRYATAQLELSRALCTLICRSAGVDARIEQDRGFALIDRLPSEQQYALFAMLERYCLAVESLAFPLPQGFSSFFTYLGYRAQPFDTFLDYVQRHVFELQIDVMKMIMSDIDDSKEGVRQKLSLLATLPRSRAKRLLNNWNHPFSMILRGRDHANNILSGNPVHPKPSQLKRRLETLEQTSNSQGNGLNNKKLTYLDTFLDLLTAKASLNEIDYNLLIESTMASLESLN
uniref:CSON005007 protein n=1 Tax=Culicoides sonorensis TaxID=179676 RepID=A0A336MW29_CULSO